MNQNVHRNAPGEDNRFRAIVIVYVGLAASYALYETIRALPSISAHPLRLVLTACVFADVALLACCAYLFKTRSRPNVAGLVLLLLGGMPVVMTAQAIARTGHVFHAEDAYFIVVPFFLLYALSATRAGEKREKT